jgi:hypothetical protein
MDRQGGHRRPYHLTGRQNRPYGNTAPSCTHDSGSKTASGVHSGLFQTTEELYWH